ncbi:MAG: hypothetical protein H7338_07510, partial [Candidatus Sericytochromatia bacterium]|nr:hypothetical protein [Candidatus Sericytochromatia bacterium]
LVGLLGTLLLPAEGPASRLTGVAFMVAVGSLLVVENRLGGILGIAFGGLGLLVGARGARGPRALVVLALAIFAVRVWLQLFLDRTNLTGYGIDLTHPYAYIGLIGGCLFVVLVAMMHQRFQARRIVLLPIGWAALVVPLLAGFLLHIEPLGAFIAGLTAVCLVWGLLRQAPEPNRLADLAAPLTGVSVTTAVLAAPWLVDMINASRGLRAGVLLAVLAVAILFMIAAMKRLPAVAQITDD